MRGLVVGLVVALAGCSTPGDVAKTAPVVTLESAKSVDAVVGCAAPKIIAQWSLSRVSPIADGQQILVSGSAWGAILGAVDVKSSGTGSRVEIRLGTASMSAMKDTIDNVKSCS
jgi:hypothetical protein